MLVELPGYGYAEASKGEIKGWTELIAELSARPLPACAGACLLINSRHGIKEPDRALMAMLDATGLSYQAVLTKVDKVGRASAPRAGEGVAEELAGTSPPIPRSV